MQWGTVSVQQLDYYIVYKFTSLHRARQKKANIDKIMPGAGFDGILNTRQVARGPRANIFAHLSREQALCVQTERTHHKHLAAALDDPWLTTTARSWWQAQKNPWCRGRQTVDTMTTMIWYARKVVFEMRYRVFGVQGGGLNLYVWYCCIINTHVVLRAITAVQHAQGVGVAESRAMSSGWGTRSFGALLFLRALLCTASATLHVLQGPLCARCIVLIQVLYSAVVHNGIGRQREHHIHVDDGHSFARHRLQTVSCWRAIVASSDPSGALSHGTAATQT